MPKYKESTVAGESWVRANKITCINEYGQNPIIHFQEEELFKSSEGKILKTAYTTNLPVLQQFNQMNANTTFDIIDPSTETSTGSTATYQDLYVLIHSLYFHLVKERDTNSQFIDPPQG